MIIAKTFKSDLTMIHWLSEPQNIEDLKVKYPPTKYNAEVNLIDRQIEIRERTDVKSEIITDL